MKNLNLFRKSVRGSEGSTLASAVVRPSFDRRLTVVKHLAFMLLFLLGSLNVWGEEVTSTMDLDSQSPAVTTSTTSFTGTQSTTWTLSKVCETQSVSSESNDKYYQIGSSNKTATSMTWTSSSFNGKKIKSIAVTGSSSGTATISVTGSGGTFSSSNASLSGSTKYTRTFTSSTPSGDQISGNLIVQISFSQATKKNIRLYQIEVVYAEGGTTEPTVLKSIAVSGDLTNKNYETTDALNLAGLTVTGSYDDDSKKEITSGITWKVRTNSTSEAVNLDAYTLTAGQTSVEVQATVNEVLSDWKTITGLTVTAASPKITITQNEVADFAATYAQYTWTAGGVSGKLYAYKNAGMQFNPSKTGYYVYNTDPIPGRITKITMTKASGTDRSWTPYVSTTAMTSASGTALDAQTVTTSGASWDVTGSNSYFYLTVSGGATVIGSIVIEYTEDAPPAIDAPSISGDVNFVGSTTVTISHEDADHIYYTTNGDDPTTSSTEYLAPFTVDADGTTTVKAIAVKGSDVSDPATKTFTKATVMTVAEALEATTGNDKYVKGIIASIEEVSTEHGNATYNLKDEGQTNSIKIYRGKYLNNVNFTAADQIIVGDEVTVFGAVSQYQSVNQFAQGNYVVAIKPAARLAWSATSFEAELGGSNSFPTLTNTSSVAITYSSSDENVATIAANGEITLKAVGTTTITAAFAGSETYKANSASYELTVEAAVIRADISFNVDGGTAVEGLTQQSNLPNPLPATSKAGKNFGGWYTDAEKTVAAVAGAAVQSTEAITLYAKWLEPYTVAEALAIINAMEINGETETAVYVAGIITPTTRSFNDTYKSITYMISDDGTANDELKVYSGKGVDNANFTAVTDLKDEDQVVVYGKLKKYQKNNTSAIEPEVNQPNYLYSFNRPAVPSITADPAAVENVAVEGVTNQTIALTYENIENYETEVTLHDDAEGTEAFSGSWLTASVSDADNYATVTYSVAANVGTARIAYIKVHTTDGDKEATTIISVSQLKYEAPASLPFAFDGGRADIENTQGMSQEGLDTDYGSSPKLKFNTTGDVVIINIADAPAKLTYDIKNNSFSGGTFDVQESADGETYTSVASYTEITGTQSEEQTLAQTTRFVKFIYTEKNNGNVGLGNITIVAPSAVETPTFSPAGGAYTGTQSVELSCTTDGAVIYYTTNGDDPDDSSTEYTAAISVDATMTIKAIAYKGDDHSEIASATYTITPALTDYYEKVTSGDVAEGTYLIVYEAGNVAFNGGLETLDASGNTIAVEITNDHKIAVTSATEAATFYIDPTAGSIQAASGKYIGQGSDANGLTVSDNALVNTLSIDEGNAVIISEGGAYMRYNANSGQERFRYFKSSSYTAQKAIQLYKLHGETIKPASGLAWDPADDIELTVGGAFSAPALVNPNSIPAGDITIESSNTDVATVSEGVVSLVENGIGTTTISATYTGETYKPITVSYKIKVNPAYSIYVDKLNVNFGSVEKDAEVVDKTIIVTLTNVAAATATLAGDGASAFSIDPVALTESGNITISASSATVGSYAATITISDDAHNAESKVVNLSLTVTEPAGEETPVAMGSQWVAAEAADLVDGAEVLITGVKDAKTYAMGADRGNNRFAVAGNLNEGVFTPGEGTMSFILVAQGDGTFALRTSNGKYLYAGGTGNSNYLNTKAYAGELDANAKWNITISSIIATSTNRNDMRFNYNNNNPALISCYQSTSTNPAVALYVPKLAPTPVYETVRENLEPNRYYTVCLARAVTAVRGASFWTLSSRNTAETEAYLEEVDPTTAEAGTPFIIQATDTKLEVVYTGAATTTAGTNGALHGTLTYMDADALAAAGTNIYMLYQNALRPVGTNNHLDANRAYINYDELDPVTEAPASIPGRRVKSMPMAPAVATGVENVQGDNVQCTKVLINGQLYIMYNGTMYNVQGQLVK